MSKKCAEDNSFANLSWDEGHASLVGWWCGTVGAGLVGMPTFICTRRALMARWAPRFPILMSASAPFLAIAVAVVPTLAVYRGIPFLVKTTFHLTNNDERSTISLKGK